MAVDFVNKSVTVLTKTRVPDSIGALFPAGSVSVSLYELSPSQLTDTMWERYSPPARPFRTFQNKAVVSSNCAQCPAAPSREPGVLFTPLPASSLSDEVLLKPSRVFDLISRSSTDYFFSPFSFQFGKVGSYMSESGFVGLKMSVKRRLLSMLLCCVYCVASLFCLHPNRNNCVTGGAR